MSDTELDKFLAHHGVEASVVEVDEDLEDFLAHYGVPGMKWGVRKDRQVVGVSNLMSGSGQVRINTGVDKPASETEIADVATATYNLHRDLISKHRAKLTKTMQDVDAKYDPWMLATNDTYVSEYDSEMSKVLTSFVQKRAPKGAKVVVESVDVDLINLMVGTPAWHEEYLASQAKHDALSEVITTPIKLIRDSDGKLIDFELEVVEHSDGLDNFLAHYGIKGMKWGVRRSDAELDRAAGRDGGSAGTKKRAKGLKGAVQASRERKERKARETLEKAAARASKLPEVSADAERFVRTSQKASASMSDQEIKKYLERSRLLKEYDQLTSKPTKSQADMLREQYEVMNYTKKMADLKREMTPKKVSRTDKFIKRASQGYAAFKVLDNVTGNELSKRVGEDLMKALYGGASTGGASTGKAPKISTPTYSKTAKTPRIKGGQHRKKGKTRYF